MACLGILGVKKSAIRKGKKYFLKKTELTWIESRSCLFGTICFQCLCFSVVIRWPEIDRT